MKKSSITSQNGQGMVEYLLMLAVIIIVAVFLTRSQGMFSNAVNRVVAQGVKEVEDMALCVNYCGDGPCPEVCGNGCCEYNEKLNGTCPADCAPCVPRSCTPGECGIVPDGCLSTMSCPDCPCPASDHMTACGIVSAPGPMPYGSTHNPLGGCPAGCGGTISADCTGGAWQWSDACTELPCALDVYNTGICGDVIFPFRLGGLPPISVNCPGGCTGSGSLQRTCSMGAWGPVSGSCSPDPCSAQNVNVPSCGSTVTLPGGTPHGPPYPSVQVSCGGSCPFGTVDADCVFGAWQNIDSGSCNDGTCPFTSNMSIGAGLVADFGPTPHLGIEFKSCPNGYSGSPNRQCIAGLWQSLQNPCVQLSCPSQQVFIPACSANAILPGGTTAGTSNVFSPCPGACTSGSVNADCNFSGNWTNISNNCSVAQWGWWYSYCDKNGSCHACTYSGCNRPCSAAQNAGTTCYIKVPGSHDNHWVFRCEQNSSGILFGTQTRGNTGC